MASISSEFYRCNKKREQVNFETTDIVSLTDNINEDKALTSFAIFIRRFWICYTSIKATSVPRNHSSTEKRNRSIVRYESSKSRNRYILRVNRFAIWMHLIYFSRHIYEKPHVSIIFNSRIRKKLTNRNFETNTKRFPFSLCSK